MEFSSTSNRNEFQFLSTTITNDRNRTPLVDDKKICRSFVIFFQRYSSHFQKLLETLRTFRRSFFYKKFSATTVRLSASKNWQNRRLFSVARVREKQTTAEKALTKEKEKIIRTERTANELIFEIGSFQTSPLPREQNITCRSMTIARRRRAIVGRVRFCTDSIVPDLYLFINNYRPLAIYRPFGYCAFDRSCLSMSSCLSSP